MGGFPRLWSLVASACAALLLTAASAAADSLDARLAGVQTAAADREVLQFLGDGARSGHAAVYVVAVKKTPGLDPRLLKAWAANGVSVAVNLRSDAWILRVAASTDNGANARSLAYLKGAVGARLLFPYVADYKSIRDLLIGKFRFDREVAAAGDNVSVEFFAGTDPKAAERILAQLKSPGSSVTNTGGQTWRLRIAPERIAALAAVPEIYLVAPVMTPRPLMSEMRAITGVDAVQNFNWTNTALPPAYDLSGLGIRMSNGEGLGASHRDFRLDLADTAARWPAATGSAGCANDNAHGAMTAGLMLGDGSGSTAGGATSPYLWRGVAPRATFVCANAVAGSGQPDVMNASFVESYNPWGGYDASVRADDAEIHGDNGLTLRVPHIRSAGNNGGPIPQYNTVVGYYSMLGGSKNSIVVGNVDALDLRIEGTESSLGPTFDNRIKPDLVAPGTIVLYVGPPGGIDIDIAYVKVSHSSSTAVNWAFSSTSNYYGWGQSTVGTTWWTLGDITPSLLSGSSCAPSVTNCLHAHMNAWPWTSGHNRPMIATFADASGNTTPPLNIVPTSNDQVQVKYRIRPALERDTGLTLFFGNQLVNDPNNNANYATISTHPFAVVADGDWHVVTIDMSPDMNWRNKPVINYLGLQFDGAPGLRVPATGGAATYGNAGGTSASGPVVAGIAALLLEKMTRPSLNVVVTDHGHWSPYYRAQPSTGAPLPSTIKAILIHTAQDLAYEPHAADLPNKDTGQIAPYFRGPDFRTGYGLANAKAAVDLVDYDLAAAPDTTVSHKSIYEDQFTTADFLSSTATPPCINGCPFGYREYDRVVASGRMLPLKVTLAYDDAPGAGNPSPAVQVSRRLVNDVELELISPSGHRYYPWTLDPLYTPTNLATNAPQNIEPQPILASAITPARRDQINDRDNVKQVVVDFPEAGTWKVIVSMKSYGMPPPQAFSLIVDGAANPPAPDMNNGKIVFAAPMPGTFGSALQLFIMSANGGGAAQITNGATNARDPSWSYDGDHIVHISDGGWKLTWIHIWIFNIPWIVWQPESINILSSTGVLQASYPTQALVGQAHAKYPDWSPDGRHIVVTTFNDWGTLQLQTIDFSAAYNFASPVMHVLVPTNFTGDSDDPADGEYSRDGRYVYFNANAGSYAGRIYKVNVVTKLVEQIYGDGAPIRRGYAVSVSQDGSQLVYNSELYKDTVPNQLDEELLSVGLQTGTIAQLTHEPGNAYGRFAKHGLGQEMLLEANTTPNGPYYLYLYENGTRSATALNPSRPTAGGFDWVK